MNYWLSAGTKATGLGGHLATINDAAEQLWLYDNIIKGSYRNYWFGLNDAISEGALIWTNGEDSNYQNWYPSWNNTAGRDYAYIRQSDGQWDLGYKNDYKLGIAEWTAAPKPASCILGLFGSSILLVLRRTKFFSKT